MATVLGLKIGNKIYTNAKSNKNGIYIKSMQYIDSIFMLSPVCSVEICYPVEVLSNKNIDVGLFPKLTDVSIISFSNMEDAISEKNYDIKLGQGVILGQFSGITDVNGHIMTYNIFSRNHCLELQDVDFTKQYNQSSIQQAIEDILGKNGFGYNNQDGSYIKNRIYPKYFSGLKAKDVNGMYLNVVDVQRSAIQNGALQDNSMQFNPGTKVYNSLQYIVNEEGYYITTITNQNKDYLYFLDTGEFANRFLDENLAKVGLQDQAINLDVLGLQNQAIKINYSGNYDNLYDELIIQRQGSHSDSNDVGVVRTIKQKKALKVFENQSAGLKFVKTLQIQKQLDNQTMNDFGEFSLQQLYAETFDIAVTVPDIYVNYLQPINKKRIYWQKAAKINVQSDFLKRIIPEIYDNQYTTKGKFILIGEKILYDAKMGLTSELRIAPSNFVS